MKTIVLDDDPTGTQSASGVTVLLTWTIDDVLAALQSADGVYLQTNSRAIDREAAVALAASIRSIADEASYRMQEPVRVVLRGDSTLRGHVFAETEEFLSDDATMLFCPAFPDGGRTTEGGTHFVDVDGERVLAADTEYALDPVFPFFHSKLDEYVGHFSKRPVRLIPLEVVRRGGVVLLDALQAASAGEVVVPDAVTNADVRRIAQAIEDTERVGKKWIVRSASPLAAELAGVASTGLIERPVLRDPVSTLVVCGSHTEGARRQLAGVAARGVTVIELDTAAAADGAGAPGANLARFGRGRLERDGVVAIATERNRRAQDATLAHGERVMTALIDATEELAPLAQVIIAKGGITSAEVARRAIGATSAWVMGQIAPGISAWRIEDRTGRSLLYIVVPGNVGGSDALANVLAAVGR